jgi:hypothetical protein
MNFLRKKQPQGQRSPGQERRGPSQEEIAATMAQVQLSI